MRKNKLIAVLLAVAMVFVMAPAAFAATTTQYTVTYEAMPSNGTVAVTLEDKTTPVASGAKLDRGTKIIVTATPDTANGYFIRTLKSGKTTITSGSAFALSSDLAIEAVFDNSPILSYNNGRTIKGGSILVVDPEGNPLLEGDHMKYKDESGADVIYTLRIQPNSGYELNGIVSKGVVNLLNENKFIIAENAHDVFFSAVFKSTTKTDDKEETKDPDTAAAKPYVIISDYSYGGTLIAGETCTLTMTFNNTSKTISVENMKVTMAMPEALMLTSSSNSFYVESLKAGASITKSVEVTAKPNAAPQSHEIGVDFDYDYIDSKVRKSNQTAEKISIPVVQVDRFEVTGVDVQPEIMVGEETSVTVNFVNKGRSDVYNLSASIAGNIQNPGQQQNLGNLASGATGSADFYVTAAQAGAVTGEITITYEDTNMQQKTKTITYSTNASSPEEPTVAPGVDDPAMTDPNLPAEEGKSGMAWYWYVVIVAALGGGAAVVIRKRKLKKLMESDENEDI